MPTKRTLLAVLLTAAMPLPVFAQDAPMPEPVRIEIFELAQISHNGVRFRFDAALADGVSVTQYQASNGEARMSSPAFTEFSFDGYSEGDYLRYAVLPRLTIYRIEDFGDYLLFSEQLDELNRLLVERPDLNRYVSLVYGMPGEMLLPLLPWIPGQVMRVLPQYVEIGNLRGVRYLVYFVQSSDSLTEGELIYTFQGITQDGQYYVSAMLPVNTGVILNSEAGRADYVDYLMDFLGQITAGGGEGFSPSLDTLDALVQSVNVTP